MARAADLAQLVGGALVGPDVELDAVAPLDEAGPSELAFLAKARYASYLAASRAGAVLVTSEFTDRARSEGRPCIVVDDVQRALAQVLRHLYPEPSPTPGVHPTAVIGRRARLGAEVSVGPHAVVGANVRIGDRVRIGAHGVVGEDAVLGDDVVLHPQVTVYRGVRIGARSILHSGVRVGVDGFGYATVDGAHRKIPQVGGCVIGEDVEIGANATIDRGSIGTTQIGDGVKIDNLVHLGHNVRVGDHSVIVAQVGVAGSTAIGRGVTLAGQAGVQGHVEIGDGATIGGQAGVFGDVPPKKVYSGYPARPHKEALRAQAATFRLPKVIKRIRALERAIFSEQDASQE